MATTRSAFSLASGSPFAKANSPSWIRGGSCLGQAAAAPAPTAAPDLKGAQDLDAGIEALAVHDSDEAPSPPPQREEPAALAPAAAAQAPPTGCTLAPETALTPPATPPATAEAPATAPTPPAAPSVGESSAPAPAPAPVAVLIRVGSRVRTEFGDEGTVRFIGSVHFRGGEWAGVELDRPKGKNDGEVMGARYFACDANHGLFTRPDNLAPLDPASPDSTAPLSRRGSVPAHVGRSTAGVPSLQRAATVFATTAADSNRVSLWPRVCVPRGWRAAWAPDDGGEGAEGRGGAAGGADSAEGGGSWVGGMLPVTVYLSSVAPDRKAARDCRYVHDFLVAKKVPHATVDLAAYPEERAPFARLAHRHLGTSAPPFPVVRVGAGLWLNKGQLQDREDHSELDPLFRRAVTEGLRAQPEAPERE